MVYGGKKRIPLEPKNNRNMGNKYTGVTQGQKIELGTFAGNQHAILVLVLQLTIYPLMCFEILLNGKACSINK